MSGSEIEGGETLNQEIGGTWKTVAGGTVSAADRSQNAGPNAHATAQISTNDVGVSGEASAKADVFEVEGNNGVHAGMFGAAAGVSGEIGGGGISAKAEANVHLADVEAAGIHAKLGLGVDTGISVGLGGVEAKVAGCGVQIGKTMGVSVLGNEFSVDIPKVWNTLTGS